MCHRCLECIHVYIQLTQYVYVFGRISGETGVISQYISNSLLLINQKRTCLLRGTT
jgi:hypothetical protein